MASFNYYRRLSVKEVIVMPDVSLTKVEFLPKHDLDELERNITELLKEFERKHKGIFVYAEIEIIKK
ncbi:MAG: hypothetical protein QXZ02_06160 [Candidatus Bathyarchaeia archaeon]